jgi:hypothetical protein
MLSLPARPSWIPDPLLPPIDGWDPFVRELRPCLVDSDQTVSMSLAVSDCQSVTNLAELLGELAADMWLDGQLDVR